MLSTLQQTSNHGQVWGVWTWCLPQATTLGRSNAMQVHDWRHGVQLELKHDREH